MSTTLRLNMPQWQGGNDPAYHFGAQLLSFLAPPSGGPEETVIVPAPQAGETLPRISGIVARDQLLAQAKAARAAIDKHNPARIVTLGGDCLVSLAPFAYLSARYGESLGILWIDAHPDLSTPAQSPHGHTYVLALLLGEGDAALTGEVSATVARERVMFAGLDEWRENANAVMVRLALPRAGSAEIAQSSNTVLDWIARENIRHLAVHFDLDVLDPATFRPLGFNRTDKGPNPFPGVPRGKLQTSHVVRLLSDVAAATDIVGLTIAEHMPWDAISFREMLADLPLMRD